MECLTPTLIFQIHVSKGASSIDHFKNFLEFSSCLRHKWPFDHFVLGLTTVFPEPEFFGSFKNSPNQADWGGRMGHEDEVGSQEDEPWSESQLYFREVGLTLGAGGCCSAYEQELEPTHPPS